MPPELAWVALCPARDFPSEPCSVLHLVAGRQASTFSLRFALLAGSGLPLGSPARNSFHSSCPRTLSAKKPRLSQEAAAKQKTWSGGGSQRALEVEPRVGRERDYTRPLSLSSFRQTLSACFLPARPTCPSAPGPFPSASEVKGRLALPFSRQHPRQQSEAHSLWTCADKLMPVFVLWAPPLPAFDVCGLPSSGQRSQ